MFNGQFSAHPALLVVRFMDCFSRMLLLQSLVVHLSCTAGPTPVPLAVRVCTPFMTVPRCVRPLVDGRWCAFAFPSGVESSYASCCCFCAPPVSHTRNLRRHR